ncbi:hypothetical protein [Spongiactinospora sp. 9N601]|uniref:hypothetical protein n=1 Tax=Spongiactinospora sp. 9N601 TaxID=3375149 RepID=UPI00379C791F
MIIFYKGYGLLVFVASLLWQPVSFLISAWISHDLSLSLGTAAFVVLQLGMAALIWFEGRRMNRPEREHTIFWIPIQYLSLIHVSIVVSSLWGLVG